MPCIQFEDSTFKEACDRFAGGRAITFLSELQHLVAFKLWKPKMQLETGMLITSIDVDVGDEKIGIINNGENDANISRHLSEYSIGKIEKMALPLFVDLFDAFEMPVTFAIRGQLIQVNNAGLKLLINAPVRHEIAAHGYSHKQFKKLSCKEAEIELEMISVLMKRFGVSPRSFIFPKNAVAHLDLLEKFGYKCYRSSGDFITDCMYIEKQGQLYDIHPSLYLDHGTTPIFVKKILDVAISQRAPFHMWFHLWNFGETELSIQKSIDRVISPVLNYAKKKVDCGSLSFETMLSAAEKTEASYARDYRT